MRIYRPGNVEWDVNATTHPPCPCWAWAYAPEMGAYRELDDGNAHHPCCQKLRQAAAQPWPRVIE